jgi:1L-myo-inositol 1-phosphate cytidylyltransferase / CDP-L-myo-inositol myo-inositolphosphotransferase
MSDRAVEPSPGSVLVVVPSGPDGRGIAPATIVAGLSLVTRIDRAATAVGYEQVLVCDGAAPGVLSSLGDLADRAPRRIVVVPANVVPQPRWLRALLEESIEPETLYVDGLSAMLVETKRADVVIAAAARAAGATSLVAELSRAFALAPKALVADGRFPLASAGDVAPAETWLLRSLIKHNEGFMSRHFERRISLAITRRLAATSVTPNMMTLASLGVGLAGASFFLSSLPEFQVTGALLFLAHSILDGCDGELARLKFLQSRGGAILDFWGDNVVHVAVFVCIAIGWALSAGTPWPLVLGAVAALATLVSAALMFEHTAEDRAVGPDSGPAARLAAALASRDFIYLIIVLSLFGKASWFLVAAAVGTPAFLLMVLWNERRHGRFR